MCQSSTRTKVIPSYTRIGITRTIAVFLSNAMQYKRALHMVHISQKKKKKLYVIRSKHLPSLKWKWDSLTRCKKNHTYTYDPET